MKTKKRTDIKSLSEKRGRVYVYLDDEKTCDRFLKKAEEEGFTFGDGIRPTEKPHSRIIAVNHNRTLNYVGGMGHIAFGSGVKRLGDEKLIRVDYRKYEAGERDCLYRPQYERRKK